MENWNNISDEKMVEKIRKNKELFRELIKRYEKKLLSYAYYFIGKKDDGADIVQEVFIKAYINLNGFDTKKKFSSWIFRIAHNEAVNFLKKHSRKVRYDDTKVGESHINIEVEIVDEEVKKILSRCLEEIPINYKEAVTLYYFDNLSYKEMSDVLQIPENTVAIRLRRAKIYLKKLCQKEKI